VSQVKMLDVNCNIFMKTGIVGVGYVGGSLSKVLDNPILFDKYKKIGSFEEVNTAHVILICVPTPYDEGKKGFDLSEVEETIKNISGEKIIVIKSTILPGTTEKLQKKYPHHKILFNPEFLTETTADQDMRYPERQIVGYTNQSYSVAGDIIQLLPLAPFERIIPATEAEMVKYFGNAWFSTKVVFANQMYDLCQALGIDYDVVKDAAAADKRIGRSHLEIFHKGYRGYGGKCLPKDIQSLIQKGNDLDVDVYLLEVVKELNQRLREMSDRERDR